MRSRYDVIIVGSGPAGIFAALELAKIPGISILLIEKGKDLDERYCPALNDTINCIPCNPCNVVSGWGGAGAYSDGKLTISTEIGGRLKEYLGEEESKKLIEEVDSIYQDFGARGDIYGIGNAASELGKRAAHAGLSLIPVMIRHIGTDCCRNDVLTGLKNFLHGKVDIKTDTAVNTIVTGKERVEGIVTHEGQRLNCTYLIAAPGREGVDWLSKEAFRIGLTVYINPVDVGVRVEVPATVLNKLTSVLYEAKLVFNSLTFNDRIRTFCMCPDGEVTLESTGGDDPVTTVNGHSWAHHKTNNTNFAVLVSTMFTEPFREPIAYGKYLARLANLLSNGVIIQRFGDLMDGRRSTVARISLGGVEPTLKIATPGDLSYALPYRYLKGIMEMLEAMDRLSPGVASPDTLLYGIEVKFYSSLLKLTAQMETEVHNLFAAGDGSGISRGLIQASASGIVAAREIRKRLGVKPA